MNSNDNIPAALADAWTEILGRYDGYRPVFYDEARGWLIVQCINTAWYTQLRVLGPRLASKLNEALPEPIIQRVVPSLREARILVTGSRTWTDVAGLGDALLDAWHDVTQTISRDCRLVVVHGDCAEGADALAKQWATDNGVIHEPHPADWAALCSDHCLLSTHRKISAQHGEYCPRAGHRRNQFMVDLGADLVLAFHRDGSRGTADCVRRAEIAGIPVRRMEARHA
jgi:hypothetical protein